MTDLRFFGGPLHGQVRAVDGNRLEVHCQPIAMDRLLYFDPLAPVRMPQTQSVTYWRRTYVERRIWPERARSVDVMIFEGSDLTELELWDLEQEVRRIPWTFPRVSFLYQFDDWWSQALYRATGKLTWNGRPVFE